MGTAMGGWARGHLFPYHHPPPRCMKRGTGAAIGRGNCWKAAPLEPSHSFYTLDGAILIRQHLIPPFNCMTFLSSHEWHFLAPSHGSVVCGSIPKPGVTVMTAPRRKEYTVAKNGQATTTERGTHRFSSILKLFPCLETVLDTVNHVAVTCYQSRQSKAMREHHSQGNP